MNAMSLRAALLSIPLLVFTGHSDPPAVRGTETTAAPAPGIAHAVHGPAPGIAVTDAPPSREEAGPPARGPLRDDAAPDDPAGRVDDYLSRLEAFGLAGGVLLAQDGEVFLARGYGLAERGSHSPAATGNGGEGADATGNGGGATVAPRRWTAGTVSTVGSITKQFTAAAIMELAERGQLSVHDSIGRFFDDVPPDKRGITLHHLLTHTSGLGEVGAGDFDFLSREEIVDRALASDLLWPPGSDYRYSNLGYSLLGAVVEIVSGRGYEAWLRDNLFVPAGMYETGYLLPAYEPERVAVGYRRGGRWGTLIDRLEPRTGPSWVLRANGGVHTTLHDMLRWVQALGVMEPSGGAGVRGARQAAEAGAAGGGGLRRPLLSAASREQMFAPHADEGGGSWYGYGWVVDTTARGTPTIRHNGGNGILHADLHLFPREGLVTFMMTSEAGLRATQLLDQVDRVYFGEDVAMPPQVDAARVEPDAIGRLAGRYELEAGGALEVESAGSALVVHVEGQAAVDRLLAGDRPGRVPYDSLNLRARSFVEAFAAGDFATLRRLIGPDAPERPLEGFRARVLDELGPLRGFDVLGTVPAWFHEGSSEATWVRIRFERTTTVRRIHWDADGLIVSLGGQVFPTPISLRCAMTSPTSCTGWQAGLALGSPSVDFAAEGAEGEGSVVIRAAGGAIRGRRVGGAD